VRAAMSTGVQRVIALSTDKAVNPINLYGATKLASDKIFIAANNLSGSSGPRFSVVRYGNVIGSRGSVIPFFRKLVAQGAASIPITDPRMTRFWITLDQGVNFVTSCLGMMQGGEIFVPKLPSMKLTDLADAIAPGITQRTVGIRAGEKLHEEMITESDSRTTVDAGDRYIIEPSFAFWNRPKSEGTERPRVAEDFRYASNQNDQWLTKEALLLMVNAA